MESFRLSELTDAEIGTKPKRKLGDSETHNNPPLCCIALSDPGDYGNLPFQVVKEKHAIEPVVTGDGIFLVRHSNIQGIVGIAEIFLCLLPALSYQPGPLGALLWKGRSTPAVAVFGPGDFDNGQSFVVKETNAIEPDVLGDEIIWPDHLDLHVG